MQHLVSMRVEQACRLLSEGRTAAETATCCGFADQAHLTREFKRRLGITPGRYRRQAGADARTAPHATVQRGGSQGRDAEGSR